MEVFELVGAAGLPIATSMPLVGRQEFEVFPHSIAVVLAGYLQLADVSKAGFRRRVLEDSGCSTGALTNQDLLDAGLAALTGLCALEGSAVAIGEPDEGCIFLPRVLAGSYQRSQ